MKTPREILLAKHKSAEPKLDRLRQEVIAGMAQTKSSEATPERDHVSFIAKLWLELFWPARRTWLGLASVWVFILVANVSEDTEPQLARNSIAPDVQAVAELKEQRHLMAQLLGGGETDADRPKSIAPRPRSEKRFEQMVG